MLRSIIQPSSKIFTRRTSTSSLYRAGSLRSFGGAREINNNQNEKNKGSHGESKLMFELLTAERAKLDAQTCIMDHQRWIRDIERRITHLEEVMESQDAPKIMEAVRNLEHNLIFNESSSRKKNTFPTELTFSLLQRFGAKSSVWIGRNLRVWQMKIICKKVERHHVSDEHANMVLARAIVSSIVLTLLAYH